MLIEMGSSNVRYQMQTQNLGLNIIVPFPTNKSGSVSLTQHKTATMVNTKSVRHLPNFDHDYTEIVVPPAPEESLPHEIQFDVQYISVAVPTQLIHSALNTSPENLFVTPLDPELDEKEEEDFTLSPLIPDKLTDSMPLDLEYLMHITMGSLSEISPIPSTSYRQERTHQLST